MKTLRMRTASRLLQRRRFVQLAGLAWLSASTKLRSATNRTDSLLSSRGEGPRITAVKTYKFNVPTGAAVTKDTNSGGPMSNAFKTWLFVKIETDAGFHGWGEGSIEWLSPVVEEAIHGWTPLLIGRNPLDVRALCSDITDRLPWKGGPVIGTAIAALNMALYDIAGKIWETPVYRILGGRRRNRVKVYHGGLNFESIEKSRQLARDAVEAGAIGLKGNPLEFRTWPMDRRELKHCAEIVRAVREEVGPDVELMLDIHGSPSPALSIAFAEMVAPYRPLFLEEPVKLGSVEALREVALKSPVPIATGEKLFSFRDFKEVIDARACAFLQPDISHSFGITNFLEVSRLAEEAQILMAPHNAGGPIHFAALMQVDAVVPNFLIQEVSLQWFRRFGEFVDHDFLLKDGFVQLSDRPGLGIEVKEDVIAALPYDENMSYRQYRNADGSWKGW